MVRKKVTVKNPSGLHLRTATVLSNSVLKYQSKIQFAYTRNNVEGTANMKSILSIVAAQIRQGQEVELICQGPDEEAALAVAAAAIEGGLEEEG